MNAAVYEEIQDISVYYRTRNNLQFENYIFFNQIEKETFLKLLDYESLNTEYKGIKFNQ